MRAEKLVSGGNARIPVRKSAMTQNFFKQVFIIFTYILSIVDYFFYLYFDMQGYFVGELMHMRTQTKERRYRCFIYQHFGKGKMMS